MKRDMGRSLGSSKVSRLNIEAHVAKNWANLCTEMGGKEGGEYIYNEAYTGKNRHAGKDAHLVASTKGGVSNN